MAIPGFKRSLFHVERAVPLARRGTVVSRGTLNLRRTVNLADQAVPEISNSRPTDDARFLAPSTQRGSEKQRVPRGTSEIRLVKSTD